jgi:ubiquinone/menaquinone biosynthesis C-methylase UbiE
MPASFDSLGVWFKLFSSWFYPRRAIKSLSHFIRSLGYGGCVVDLGCGSGTLIEFAHSMRSDMCYICVDPAQGMLKYVQPYAWRVMALGEELPFKDNVVGAIMIGDAIHHFTEPHKGISEAMRTLMPGGKLFIFDINRQTVLGWLISHMEKSMDEPAHFYTPDELKNLLIAKGFKVLTISHPWRYTIEALKE